MSLVPRGNFLDLDRVFDNIWSPLSKAEAAETGFFSPRVDIKEKKNHYEITAELPGVDQENIHVELEDGVLTISAETRQEDTEEKEGRVIRQERRYGKYMRSFNLGSDIHEEDITAAFKGGVLKLSAPKATEVTPARRRIDIS